MINFLSKYTDVFRKLDTKHVAPMLDAGFIEYEEQERKKVYHLTEKGEMLLKALE